MSEQNIIQAQSIADVLAAIPALLGYAPADSAVLLCLRGARTGLTVRIDLADVTPEVAEQIVGHATRDRATGAVLVAYTEDEGQAREVVRTFTEALHGQAIDVREAQQVTATDYRDLLTPGVPVRPVSDLQSTAVAAAYVVAGRAIMGDLAATLPQPAPQAAQDTARRAAAAHAAEHADEPARFALATWRLANAGLVAGPTIYGHLAQMLTRKATRDAFLVCLTTDEGSTLPEKVIVGLPDEETATAARNATLALTDVAHARRPGEDGQTAIDVLAQVIAHNPNSADAWAFWALLTWWQGNLAGAREGFERALALDALQGLARVMYAAVQSGYAPGWIQRQD
ncbi:DUF4192 family protein [Oerskovia enterophila]|uniref:DUF4192 family protein n=1 Tax=Oerskovia enterophila TaxID=43678 RepID=UPI00339AA01F